MLFADCFRESRHRITYEALGFAVPSLPAEVDAEVFFNDRNIGMVHAEDLDYRFATAAECGFRFGKVSAHAEQIAQIVERHRVRVREYTGAEPVIRDAIRRYAGR